ncbi:hypothetical protein [Cohaesibacter celericrescens]|uniref:Uncharacterized protein n=1 Tax=Cohaesibacter celericrescens TaxID=2067669 RepID=A0A2N5XLK1_9HYPH|nr:hypothetical protein [Cohaesibacter celericrescens]PLW75399.1 hypothetical protein C0081_20245 [Cohaesibacter celericrescens]
MAEHKYKFLNAFGEVRTVRTTVRLSSGKYSKLKQVLEQSGSPASLAPSTWGEVVLIYGFDDQFDFRIAGITTEETRRFIIAVGHRVKSWELRDDMGLCMGGVILPSGPDFSRMDERRAS